MRVGVRWAVAGLVAALLLGGGPAGAEAAAVGSAVAPTGGGTAAGTVVSTATVPPQSQSQPPTLVSPRTVTLQDAGATVLLPVGATFLLKLGTPPPSWQAAVGDTAVLARVPNVLVILGAQGIYRALAPGVTELTATSSYPCQQAHPACEIASRLFRVVVVVAPAAVPAFPDVPQGYWAHGAIETLAAAGVVGGFPDGTFRPEQAVTRAEFVKLLDAALGLAPASGTGGFADVSPGSWFAPYVAAVAKAGLVQGVSPTRFAPDQAVTREQLAVWLARALNLAGGAAPGFTDAASIGAWAVPAVAAAVQAGYLHGFPDGSFRPLDPATRAQAAQVLAAVLAATAR